MIPVRLLIKNFLSYGPAVQTIDFTAYNLICLSGKNGHGKSALLDALTWALWGVARKIPLSVKPDEGLLRLGETHMMVALDFICNDQMYRVRREYSTTTGKASTNLDFGIVHPGSEQFKALTDKTIRATQDKIDQIVGLCYDSFVNSVFLRQGQSNEFSRKSPKDRKEILAAILGLEEYENVRKKALEKMRQAQQDYAYLTKLQEHIQKQFSDEETIREQLERLQDDLVILVNRESQLTGCMTELEKQKKELISRLHEAQIVELTYQQVSQSLTDAYSQLSTKVTQSRTVLRQMCSVESYDVVQQKMQVFENESRRLQECAQRRFLLQEKLLRAKQNEQLYKRRREDYHAEQLQQYSNAEQTAVIAAQAAQLRLHDQKKVTDETYNNYQQLLREKNRIQKDLDRIGFCNNTVKKEEVLYERRKLFYQRYEDKISFLKNEQEIVIRKKNLVGSYSTVSCPVCDQSLSAEQNRKLYDTLLLQESLMNHQLQRLVRIVEDLKGLIEKQEQYLCRIKHQQVTHNRLEIALEELTKSAEKLKDVVARNEEAYSYLQQEVVANKQCVEERLKRRKMYQEQIDKFIHEDPEYRCYQEQVILVERDLEAESYDASRYDEIQKEMLLLKQHLKDHQELFRQASFQNERAQVIHELCLYIRAQKKHLCELTIRRESSKKYEQDKICLDQAYENLNEQRAKTMKQKEELLHQKGALEQQKTLCFQLKKQYHEQVQKSAELEIHIEEYQAIAHALSKDGIQALLIEGALPDIEQEANYLLAKLTDNQAHLTIESLRDLKSGGTKETLDIKISDSLGIRPYELFSGGEAFRIDFALRIAISKLLARRAGTSLQTLIIDEGFGSQDEEGISHIMDVLHKIQDDFAKIIVVSHLSTMKEQFPVHFLVHKGPQGSTVRVIELG
jgi:DNA repair protein SbcC/Rad50